MVIRYTRTSTRTRAGTRFRRKTPKARDESDGEALGATPQRMTQKKVLKKKVHPKRSRLQTSAGKTNANSETLNAEEEEVMVGETDPAMAVETMNPRTTKKTEYCISDSTNQRYPSTLVSSSSDLFSVAPGRKFQPMVAFIIGVVSLAAILTASGLLWFWFVRSQD